MSPQKCLCYSALAIECSATSGETVNLPDNSAAWCWQEGQEYMLRIRDIKLVQSQTAEAMAQLKALLRSQRSFGMQVISRSSVSLGGG